MLPGARLQEIAAFIPEGSSVADIGTDHAYLPVFLVEQKHITKAVACDVNEGPCKMAEAAIAAAGMRDQIELRRGDGLQPLQPGEVEYVTIAGMGGSLMCSILEASPEVLDSLSGLVLQPMNAACQLRQWLYEHGWHIERESLVVEDGRLYEIIFACPGKCPLPDALALLVGPQLLQQGHPLFSLHIEGILQQERKILAGMEQSETAKKSEKYRWVAQKIQELEQMKK